MAISMSQDITELREKDEAMRRLQKMESLGKLAGGIAHDFNNLLVAINGYSEMGLQEVALGSRLEEYFQEILRSGKRAASLTQQLLAYSRKQIIQPRPLDINGAVRDMEKLLKRLIGENIRVGTELGDGLPPVAADPGQLEQLILNLVVNARDAMPDGGDLLLATGLSRLDEDRLRGNPDAQPGLFVKLAIADTGTGMAPEVLERAFEPFFTTKPVGKGTGLGLASVYGIVKQGGGHIEVESAPGAGSTFSVFLPVAKGAAAASREEEEARTRERRTGTILLVEDEESVRNFTRLVLENRGYRVHAAADGAEALRLAGMLPEAHLLVTDVVMPGMRGPALAEAVREMHPDIKVLLMSGYLEEGALHAGKPGSGTAFLQKPYPIEQLAAIVDALLKAG
jgi:nitrogen-specific signal transduction histidine kinase/ActR/RegA family two-component response regulator